MLKKSDSRIIKVLESVRFVAVVYHFIAWKCLFIGCKDALDLPAWYLVNRRIF